MDQTFRGKGLVMMSIKLFGKTEKQPKIRNLVRMGALVLAMGIGGFRLMAQVNPDASRSLPVPSMQDPTVPNQPGPGGYASPALSVPQDEGQLEEEIRRLKAKEKGPKRFAEDLFSRRQKTTSATEGGIAEDYVLGTGDKLALNVFGSATFEAPLQVDGRGALVVPKVGTVKVGGMSLGKARLAVQSLVARNFSNATVELQVTGIREVRIFLLGEVYKPGTYLVSSLSSIVNILSLGGGPTMVGSFRQVRVVRGGGVVHSVDLYPLRSEGLGNLNFSFQNGDVVFVPLAFNQVVLQGAFTRVTGRETEEDPKSILEDEKRIKLSVGSGKTDQVLEGEKQPPQMQFEMLPGETAQDAFRYAGGLLQNAFNETLALRRQDANGQVNILDVPVLKLTETNLRKGDILSALPRRDHLERLVSIGGWVRVPGAFARKDGLRIGDLLLREKQVLPDTFLERGEIIRTLPNGDTRYLAFNVSKAIEGVPSHNLLIEDRDKIELFRNTRLKIAETVEIDGPLTHAGIFPFYDGMRVSDLIFKAGIPKKSANRLKGELARSRFGKISETFALDLSYLLSTELISPVEFNDDKINPLLKPDDRISLFETPEYKVHRVVRISGEIARPGSYVLDAETKSLSQLIVRAGGLTPASMPKGALFLRPVKGLEGLKMNKNEEKNLVKDPDLATSPAIQGVNDVLERLSETKRQPSTGQMLKNPILHGLSEGKLNRMVIDFESVLKNEKDSDVDLQDGDEIIIPQQTDAAYVVGEAASPFATYKVRTGMTVKDIIRLAGGTTRNADTWNIRLLRADGRILDSWVMSKKIEPGDTVLIPQKVRRDSSWQENLTALTPLAILLNVISL